MGVQRFEHTFSQERKATLIIASIQIAFLVTGVSLAIASWREYSWLTLLIALISILLFFFLLTYLIFRFRALPAYKQKLLIENRAKEIEDLYQNIKAVIDKAVASRERITENEKTNLAQRQSTHTHILNIIQQKRNEIFSSAKKEHAEEMGHLQKRYITMGLRQSLIRDASIEGVGKKMKNRLAEAGISSAADVAVANVSAVPGFGEAKTLSVINWRRSVERRLDSTKPTKLPQEVENRLRQKYSELLQQTKADEVNEKRQLELDVRNIKGRVVQEHARNDKVEVEAREKLERIIPQKQKIESVLSSYDRVTFWHFIKHSLPLIGKPTASRRGFMIGGVSIVIVVGFCWQSAAALGSLRHIYIASLPTQPPTFTITPTFTPSQTSTPSSTPTHTLTPTTTSTPTITITPSITPTPTITLTPSVTPTPTMTLPPIVNIGCVPKTTKREVGTVVNVEDGDTIVVKIEGVTYDVRYIGIDSPEGGEPYAYEAGVKNRELVYGKTVILVKDVSETDRYNRLLRYVLTEDTFVNRELVYLGYAIAKDYPPDSACRSTFESAERDAKSEEKGMWAPTPTPYPTSAPEPTERGDCDPAYPTVCIPSPPPDLDCGDITYRRFKVLPPDPHNFDGDHDGVGCESG